MNRTAFLAIVLAAVIGGTATLVARADNAPSPTVVHIKSFAYTPQTLTVKTGDTVEFVNDDEAPHTVTATDNKAFDSGNLDQHATWKHTFAKAGTYTYICTYHTYMKGTIVVKDAT